MNTHSAFCTSCDRAVRLTWTPAPGHDGEANLRDAELVCLDFGERCATATCPISHLPRVVMGVRLARSGLREGPWRTLHAYCEGCGSVQEQEVIDASYVVCTLCRSTNRWVRLEADDAWVVALAPAVHGIPLPGATDVPD